MMSPVQDGSIRMMMVRGRRRNVTRRAIHLYLCQWSKPNVKDFSVKKFQMHYAFIYFGFCVAHSVIATFPHQSVESTLSVYVDLAV